jgi:hypothetical protein
MEDRNPSYELLQRAKRPQRWEVFLGRSSPLISKTLGRSPGVGVLLRGLRRDTNSCWEDEEVPTIDLAHLPQVARTIRASTEIPPIAPAESVGCGEGRSNGCFAYRNMASGFCEDGKSGSRAMAAPQLKSAYRLLRLAATAAVSQCETSFHSCAECCR